MNSKISTEIIVKMIKKDLKIIDIEGCEPSELLKILRFYVERCERSINQIS